jgi:nitrite reductase (NADH) small subunit
MAFQRVADIGEIPPGAGHVVALGEQRIALFRLGGDVLALDGVCPHEGGPLGLGDVEAGCVTCPLHGWRFDLLTGACVGVPGERVERYAVRVEGAAVYVDPEPGG